MGEGGRELEKNGRKQQTPYGVFQKHMVCPPTARKREGREEKENGIQLSSLIGGKVLTVAGRDNEMGLLSDCSVMQPDSLGVLTALNPINKR